MLHEFFIGNSEEPKKLCVGLTSDVAGHTGHKQSSYFEMQIKLPLMPQKKLSRVFFAQSVEGSPCKQANKNFALVFG
jgi:hypothetical protein